MRSNNKQGGHKFAEDDLCNTPTKTNIRADLLSRISNNFGKTANLSMLTFPSTNWLFETSLLDVREQGRNRPRNTYITSIEHNTALFEESCLNMPLGADKEGNVSELVDLPPAPFARRSVRSFAITRFHMCSFERMATWMLDQPDEIAPKFDCAWLDFNGTLTPQLVQLIPEFADNCITNMLAITVYNVLRRANPDTRRLVNDHFGGVDRWLMDSLDIFDCVFMLRYGANNRMTHMVFMR